MTKKTNSSTVAEARVRRKKEAVALLGGQCIICGYSKAVSALEFHHIDPASKDFGISSDGITRSKQRVYDELKKCILVCANCHREIHAGVVEAPKQTVFNYELESFLLKNIVSENFLEIFQGKEAKKDQIKARPNREELKDLIRHNSFLSIGSMYGVSDNAIRKWCINHRLPSTKIEIKSYSDEEWILL